MFWFWEADDGQTRFGIDDSRGWVLPVVGDAVVHGILRGNGHRIERLSLRDGTIVDSKNLGIDIDGERLAFAVSDRTGGVYLIANGQGGAVLWDTASGERSIVFPHRRGRRGGRHIFWRRPRSCDDGCGRRSQPVESFRRGCGLASFGAVDCVGWWRVGRRRRRRAL